MSLLDVGDALRDCKASVWKDHTQIHMPLLEIIACVNQMPVSHSACMTMVPFKSAEQTWNGRVARSRFTGWIETMYV
jgi:hypothetical protein